jgi:hypothetical protein
MAHLSTQDDDILENFEYDLDVWDGQLRSAHIREEGIRRLIWNLRRNET